MGSTRSLKMIDTCVAKFETKITYFYYTYENKPDNENSLVSNESKVSTKKKIIEIGSGPNRIGQGIEFDY